MTYFVKVDSKLEMTMIKLQVEFTIETHQYIPWRPPIRPSMLYDTIFINSKLYLFDIKKITFVSHVLPSDDIVERNAKNHRFLAFRQNFSSSSDELQMPKIAKNRICACLKL